MQGGIAAGYLEVRASWGMGKERCRPLVKRGLETLNDDVSTGDPERSRGAELCAGAPAQVPQQHTLRSCLVEH